MPRLSWQQYAAIETFEWILDPRNRRAGKSTAQAIAIIRAAWRHRGRSIHVRDFEAPRSSDGLLHSVSALIHTDPVYEHASINRRESTLTIATAAPQYPGNWLPPGWELPTSFRQWGENQIVPAEDEPQPGWDPPRTLRCSLCGANDCAHLRETSLLNLTQEVESFQNHLMSALRVPPELMNVPVDRQLAQTLRERANDFVRNTTSLSDAELERIVQEAETEMRAEATRAPLPRQARVNPGNDSVMQVMLDTINGEISQDWTASNEDELPRLNPSPVRDRKTRKLKTPPEPESPPPPPPRTLWDWLAEDI